nr:MAG TPA: hypothetical protein [Caudoviricetes sp.]DAM59113.1 MAG TPA: hypothetical protein [Caudoviricetes sp.]
MTELINPVPIEIVDLGIETYAQIEIEKILLTSYPPIEKTILKFITDFTMPRFGNYSIKIKNDDAVIKCYVVNTLGTFIQKDASERTVAEWLKVISRSEKYGRDNPLNCQILPSSSCQDADKISKCDHDFEECEIYNPYNYNFNEFKPRETSNIRFHPYYCKKCGMLILKRVDDKARGIDKFLWEDK